LFDPAFALRRRIALTCLAACIGLPASAHEAPRVRVPGSPPGITLPPTAEPLPPPPAWDGVAYRRGVVSAAHPLAAQAGSDVLARGGNAIDAAAAVQFVLNVVEPQFTGIGGGGFLLIHLARQNRTVAIDGRETAPLAATPTQFQLSGVSPADRFNITSTTGLAVGVPGTLAAWDLALRRYGTRPLAEVLSPAIQRQRPHTSATGNRRAVPPGWRCAEGR
jgi:gamma-glutamyltranspeptidase / glutathione hydrolase